MATTTSRRPSAGERLLSRKFWLALLACIYFGIYHQFASITQVVVAYLAVTASMEAFTAWTDSRSSSATSSEDPELGEGGE